IAQAAAQRLDLRRSSGEVPLHALQGRLGLITASQLSEAANARAMRVEMVGRDLDDGVGRSQRFLPAPGQLQVKGELRAKPKAVRRDLEAGTIIHGSAGQVAVARFELCLQNEDFRIRRVAAAPFLEAAPNLGVAPKLETKCQPVTDMRRPLACFPDQ